MRIILKPAGAIVVIAAFGTLIGLLAVRDRKPEAKTASDPLPLTDASTTKPGKEHDRANTGNLLQNAGFESDFRPTSPNGDKATLTGDTAFPWRDDSGWAHVDASYASDQSILHNGSSSQRITVLSVKHPDSPLDSVQFVQELTLTRGKRYNAGIWLRSDRTVDVTFSLRQASPPFTSYGTRTITVKNKWQQVNLDAEVTQEGKSFLMLNAASPTVLWADDAHLEESGS